MQNSLLKHWGRKVFVVNPVNEWCAQLHNLCGINYNYWKSAAPTLISFLHLGVMLLLLPRVLWNCIVWSSNEGQLAAQALGAQEFRQISVLLIKATV